MSLLWRALATALVAVALGVTAWGLVDAVRANNQTDSPTQDQSTTTADIRVNGFGDPQGLTITNLTGARLPGAAQTATVNARGIAPSMITAETSPQLLALTRPTGELAGLTWLSAAALQSAVSAEEGEAPAGGVLSPQTTARSLVALAPGVLDSNGALTERRLSEVENTAEFDALVAEVARAQDLRVANERLERALAAVLDRIPGDATTPDPGCDAAAGSSSVTAAGTCVIALRTADTAEILNGHDRWVGVFAPDAQQVCAVVPPRPASLMVAVPAQCPLVVDLAAPGPTLEAAGPTVTHQVRVASLLSAFGQFGEPFAQLVLGAPRNDDRGSRPLVTADQVNTFFVPLALGNAEVAAQIDSLQNATVPAGRQTAALLGTVRAALAQPGLADSLFGPSYVANAEGAALLSLFERSLAYRTGGTNPLAFTAPGWDRVDISELFDRAGG